MAADNRSIPRSQKSGLLEEPHGSEPTPISPQLTAVATGLVDREDDLAAISSLLLSGEVRLLTLTGPAGVGKTRLAREVGRQVAAHFPQGVAFVDLTPVRDPALVLPTIGQQLGVLDSGGPPFVERLQAYLSDREMLVILDNVEQVLPASVGLEELLLAAPGLTLLATSRQPLHLLWEQLYHVPPLALPDPRHLPSLDKLMEVPSVALFLRRSQMMDPDFRLTEENARATAELMVHLDGLPLAIKLAAARIQFLSPQMLLERLGQRLSLLHWEAQDLPERQQTLRAAIAWSYDQLSPQEQALFRCLGIFAREFTLEAAEAIAAQAQLPSIDVLEGVGSLVDKSLVQRAGGGAGSYRFRLLESVREFALERVVDAGELEAAGRSHALYYLELAERAEPELTGSQQRAWFLKLEEMQDDMRTALTWQLDHDGEAALRLAVALAHFWEIRGHLAEGQRWLEAALARATTTPRALRAKAITWLGAILALSVDYAGASDAAAHARDVLADGMELARTVGDAVSIARALTFLGVISLQTGDWGEGKRTLQEAQSTWQIARHDREIIQALVPLGVIAFLEGRHEEATRLMDEILSRYRDVGDDFGRGVALLFSVHLRATQGDVSQALAMARELVGLSDQSHSGRLSYLAAVGVAWLARSHCPPPKVASLVGAAASIEQAIGLVDSLMQRVYVTPTIEALQERMGREDLDAALLAGRRLPSPQVAELAREILEAREEGLHQEPDREKSHSGTMLSSREHEVLQLVAEGLSNKQIAKELIIAESTVRYHLTSIFNKLGVDTRTHALAVAAQRGLIQLGAAR